MQLSYSHRSKASLFACSMQGLRLSMKFQRTGQNNKEGYVTDSYQVSPRSASHKSQKNMTKYLVHSITASTFRICASSSALLSTLPKGGASECEAQMKFYVLCSGHERLLKKSNVKLKIIFILCFFSLNGDNFTIDYICFERELFD